MPVVVHKTEHAYSSRHLMSSLISHDVPMTDIRREPCGGWMIVCNFDKPISATQCFVETNEMVIDPLPEYFNDNISPCDSNAHLTCNSFISDQSFKSNLTGRIYKTQTYEQLTCGSLNVVYTIHCIRCSLMHVGETGRSLQSRINGHRAGIIKGKVHQKK